MQPVKVKMENFLSHANSELDFDFTSALIVGAYGNNERLSNGAGKSSLLESIGFALYNQTRHKNLDDLVKRGQVQCRVELIFKHDDETYRVIRTRNVKYSRSEVEFERLVEGGEPINLTQDTNRATDTLIRKTINSSYDVFINSTYFRQNMGFDFAEGTFASRQSLISMVLDLAKWSDYQDYAKKLLKEYSAEVDKLKEDVSTLDGAEKELEEVKAELKSLHAESKSLKQQEDNLAETIKDLEIKVDNNNGLLNDINKFSEMQRQFKKYKDYLQNAEKALEDKKAALKKAKNSIEATQDNIENTEKEIAELEQAISQQNTIDVEAMENSVMDGRVKYKTIADQIKNLTHNDECIMCGNRWDDPDAKKTEVEKREDYLNHLQSHLKKAEETLKQAKEHMRRLRNMELEISKKSANINQLINSMEFLEGRVNSLTQEIKETEDKIEEYIGVIADLEERLKSLSHIHEMEDISEIEKTLTEYRQQLKEMQVKSRELVFAEGQRSQQETSLTEQIKQYMGAREKLAEAIRKATIYGKLSKVFSKDGIQAIIIDNAIEDLTRVVNHWLTEFCNEPTYINFITQKKNTKGDWRETLEIEIHTPSGITRFESLSGGEKFRVGFAIRLALSVLQARRMGGEVQILLLDEVSTSLDAAGLETFMAIIRKLEREMKVMLITHDDKLKEEFDTIITVRRIGDSSYIER